ncbi:MAG: DUF2156 domain-containing protein [Microbacterium sp.]
MTAPVLRSAAEHWRFVARRYLTAHPVALGASVVVVVAAALTGSLWGQDVSYWGTGPLSVFVAGHWWTPFTAVLVPGSPVDAVICVALALTVYAYAEDLLGHLALVWVTAVTGLGGIVVAIGLHAASWTVTDLRPVEAEEIPVVDPAIAIAGAVMAASAVASALWRRRIRLIGFAVLAMFALYVGDADSWYRLASAVLGLAGGAWLTRRSARRPWHRSSVREIRALTAALVAVTGLGPFAAVIADGGRGPLSLAVDAFTQYDQDLIDRCNTHYTSICEHQFTLLVTRGAGPAILALVPLALLLVAAWGMQRGRRAGMFLAIAVETLVAALAVYSLLSGQLYIDPWVDGTGFEYLLWAVASIGVPLATAVLLVVLRRRFPVRARASAVRGFSIIVLSAFAVCAAGYVVAEWLLRQTYNTDPSFADLLVETVRRFIPSAFLQGVSELPYPRHGAALWIYQWVGVAFWAVVVVAMLWLYRRIRVPAAADDARFRALLRRGGGTLGYLGLWRGNRHWYSDDRQSAVAYRLVGDVAIAIADPLTTTAHREQAIRGFVDFCVGHGWLPVFYSIHDEFLPVFDAMGWEHTSVGEETVMVLADVTLTGKAWQKVRQPMMRAEREGVRAVWTRWQDLGAAQIAQIEEIDEQWVTDKALPEMGFTLGSIEEAKDPEVALLLAVDAVGRIQVVTSWMPSWRDGIQVGWTLDFMRRRADGPNGLMEFVIAKAALSGKMIGLEVLSLSGAPLALKPGEEPSAEPTVLTSLLAWMAQALEPAYGFASLFRFKSKFRPEYRTIHLAYADPVTLPRIGVAVGRAYLPDASARDVLALARAARGGAR